MTNYISATSNIVFTRALDGHFNRLLIHCLGVWNRCGLPESLGNKVRFLTDHIAEEFRYMTQSHIYA